MPLLPLVLILSACGTRATDGLSASDRAACSRATPVRGAISHLKNFDVWAATIRDRVATDPLWPHYPSALLPGKIGIAPLRHFNSPVTITAFHCPDGQPVRLFIPSAGHYNLSLPRPASAEAVRVAGSASVKLVWPPPVQSLGDPDRWFVTPLDDRPGRVVWRFTLGGKVLDRLTFRVCVGDTSGRCPAA